MKDANGDVARGYTFRIEPDAKFEGMLQARTVEGMTTTAASTEGMWLRDPSYTRELQLLKARRQFHMNADGTLTSLLSGYRPWFPIYRGAR